MINSNHYNNKQLHQSLRDNPIETMRAQGIEFDETKQYITHTNTANLIYIVIPEESITSISQHDFEQIQAATKIGTLGTAGSVASASTVSTVCGTAGSGSSASTAGSAGTAISVEVGN